MSEEFARELSRVAIERVQFLERRVTELSGAIQRIEDLADQYDSFVKENRQPGLEESWTSKAYANAYERVANDLRGAIGSV